MFTNLIAATTPSDVSGFTTVPESQFIDGARLAVLGALDGYMRVLTGCDNARGATDADLPELFSALDAHMRKVAKRFNDPESQEIGSAALKVVEG